MYLCFIKILFMVKYTLYQWQSFCLYSYYLVLLLGKLSCLNLSRMQSKMDRKMEKVTMRMIFIYYMWDWKNQLLEMKRERNMVFSCNFIVFKLSKGLFKEV